MFTFAFTAIILVISDGTDGKRTKRFFGGRNAQLGEHSWAVTIGLKDESVHTCGGSIIDARYVLTAAHCVLSISPENLVVRSGIVDLLDTSGIVSPVSRIIMHPGYVRITAKAEASNDIAILQLGQNLELGGRVRAIKLPTRAPREMYASFAGWGAREPKAQEPSRILQIATMKIVWDSDCEWALGTPGRMPQFICAFHEDGMILQGDSGSALTNSGEIIGIAEAGTCEIAVPSSFANVYHYLDWINEIVGIGNNV